MVLYMPLPVLSYRFPEAIEELLNELAPNRWDERKAGLRVMTTITLQGV
jgi:hypothetical protein